MDKLRVFSDTATGLVNDTQDDLVKNLQNLEPTLRALADVGPGLDRGLAFASVFPFGQNLIDRGLKGDYFNFFGQIDLTVPRLKRSLLLGTRFGDEKAPLVAAPGEPYYLKDGYDPQGYPVAPPPTGGPLSAIPGNPPTPALNALPPGVLLPVTPPPSVADAQIPPPPGQPAPVFAGPYQDQSNSPPGGG